MNPFDELSSKRLGETLETVRQGVIAGAAGGVAEIVWVTLYAGATGANPAMLARGVTTAAGASALFPAAAPVALGVTLHMGIAALLGIALAFVWRTLSAYRPVASPFPFVVAALIGIWAINFFVVLPIVSPAFIQLVPYPVSLMSKVMFGLAAAEVFRFLADPTLNMHRVGLSRRAP